MVKKCCPLVSQEQKEEFVLPFKMWRLVRSLTSILGKTFITGTVTFTGNLDLHSKEYSSNDTAGTLLLLQVFSACSILLLFTKPAKTLG